MSQTKAQLISDLVQALNFTGTSSAPANGMYLSAANTIKLATNSNGRLTIDSSGNATFTGTCTATSFSGSGANLTNLPDKDQIKEGNSYAEILDTGTNGIFRFLPEGSEVFRIDKDGNVGINTNNPAYTLDVIGDGGISVAPTTNSTVGQISIVGKNSSGAISAISRLKSNPDGSGNQSHLSIETRKSDASMAEAIRITSDQKVGIGTTSPNARLHCLKSGQINLIVGSSDAGGSYLVLDGDSNGDSSGSDYSYIGHTTSGDLELAVSNPDGNGNIYLKSNNYSYQAITCHESGPVELRYQNTARLETTSTGVEVKSNTGDTELKIKSHNATSQSRLLFSDSSGVDANVSYDHNDRKMYLGAASATGLNGDVVIDTSGGVGFGTSTINLNASNGLVVYGQNQSEIKLLNSTSGTAAGAGFSIQKWNNSNTYVYEYDNVTLSLGTNNATKFQILNGTSGDVKVVTGNLVIGTSGKGIDFSATSDAGGNTSELLDDYEEGTWTPGLHVQNLTGQSVQLMDGGKYTKIGNRIWGQAYLKITNIGSGASNTGAVYINGLPFTSGSGHQNAVVHYWSNMTVNIDFITGTVQANSTNILLRRNTAAQSNISNMPYNDLATNCTFILSFTYNV